MNQPFYIIKIPKYNKEIIFSPKKYVCVQQIKNTML